jgi:uncharacterized membrane protein
MTIDLKVGDRIIIWLAMVGVQQYVHRAVTVVKIAEHDSVAGVAIIFVKHAYCEFEIYASQITKVKVDGRVVLVTPTITTRGYATLPMLNYLGRTSQEDLDLPG